MGKYFSHIVLVCLVISIVRFEISASEENFGKNAAMHAGSEGEIRSKRSAESGSHGNDDVAETHEIEKRNARPRGRGPARVQGTNLRDEDEPVRLTVSPCLGTGVTLAVGGNTNYYMKCVVNKKTGGFFQTLFICPANALTDKSTCIPPPDCSRCGDKK